jgi:hypothetical protein
MILYRIASARSPAILVVAPIVSDDNELTARAYALWRFILDQCAFSGDYSNTVQLFESQSSMEDYVTDRHYDDVGYGYGKVAFSIVINSVDHAAVQWDYSIRANYTSFFDQDDHTVACLYGGYKSCDFTYTIPSTKFYTEDLFKPQSTEYLYGYTFSGFSTLQQVVDQFIFAMHSSNSAVANGGVEPVQVRRLSAAEPVRAVPETPAGSTAESAESDADRASLLSAAPATDLEAKYPGLVKIMASVSLMPTDAYKTDDFQYIISSTLGIFYMLSFLYPVSRIVRALVLEKETRIKEGECLCLAVSLVCVRLTLHRCACMPFSVQA